MDSGNDNEIWDWQGEDYCLQEDTSSLGISKSLWNGVSHCEEDLSFMFDETTPIKDYEDLAYHVTSSENSNKGLEQCRETFSQIKRRRMLQFDTEVLNVPFCNEEMPSELLKSKQREDFSDMSQWASGFSGNPSASGYKGLHSSEGWLADCFNDTEMHLSPDDMNHSGGSDVQIDIAEFCDTPPESEACMVQQRPVRTRKNVVFKGRKSYMQTPTKLASSVVYPFAFIKPCGVHGDVTLKDINQRIQTPPPLKLSKKNDEDPSTYPTSAFSGKPVVGKTKIHTEGGKGCITIMRTKG